MWYGASNSTTSSANGVSASVGSSQARSAPTLRLAHDRTHGPSTRCTGFGVSAPLPTSWDVLPAAHAVHAGQCHTDRIATGSCGLRLSLDRFQKCAETANKGLELCASNLGVGMSLDHYANEELLGSAERSSDAWKPVVVVTALKRRISSV